MAGPPPAWESLLAAPRPGDHVVQLYTDEAFLVRALTCYVEHGLAAGEASVLIATAAHLRAVVAALGAVVDVGAATARDQVVLLDARACLATFMRDGGPDRDAFRATITAVLGRVRAAGHARVRLFGEMVDLLWQDNLPATERLEALWGELLAERQVCLLCAYRVDTFDRHAHRGLLPRIGRSHTHLMPVEDEARYDEAVDRACRDVFGPGGEGDVLRRLLAARPSTPCMPPAHAALVALRELGGDIADAVLARARRYYERPAVAGR